jgi:DNA-binding CsgD family transcriptional regulator
MPWRIADLLDLGHVRAADEAIATAARLAEELRQPLYLWYAAMFQALRVLMEGRFAEGERLAQAAHAIGERVHPRVSSIYFAAQLFVLRREQGRLAELEPIFKDILEWYPGMPIFRCMLALSYLQSDRAADARAELERLCADRAAALPWDQLWLGSMAILAEVSVLLGDNPHAAMLYDLLLPYTRRNVMVGVPICFGSASAYLGSLAAALGRWDTAARHFEDALALDSKIGAKPFLARAKYAYGAMLLQRGRATDRERASELLAQAHAAAEEFGMIHLSGQILSLRAAVPEHRATRANPSGLTDRELEVLRLIAAGKSTKEIALALVVSVPTVERHITNLYGKIGARSRADATVYALRHHLT